MAEFRPLVPLSPERQKARAARAAAGGSLQRGPARHLHGLVPAGALHHSHRLAALPADHLQQRFSDFSEPWIRGDRSRDDPQRPHYSRGRPSASGQGPPPVAGRFAGPLGGRYPGRRNHQFPDRRWRDLPERQSGDLQHHRALHARGCRYPQLRIHGRGSARPGPNPGRARIPWVKIDPEEQMYEYACHEDNYDMVHFLAGARAREKKGETK